MKLRRHSFRVAVKALVIALIALCVFLATCLYRDGLKAQETTSEQLKYSFDHSQVIFRVVSHGKQSLQRPRESVNTSVEKNESIVTATYSCQSSDCAHTVTTPDELTPAPKNDVQDANVKIRQLFDKWDGYKNVKMPKLFDPLNPPKEMNTSKRQWTEAIYFQKPDYLPKISFLMNNEVLCGQEPVDVIIYVHSSPDHHIRRNHIRESWGSVRRFKKVKIRTIFLIGVLQENDERLHNALRYEQALFRDIIKGNFIDSYRNLTLKAIMGLQWIATYCSQARYVFKSDDDMLINIFAALRYLYVDRKDDKHFIACSRYLENTMPILRNPETCLKWCVDDKELVGRDMYPRYCSGAAFIMTSDVALELYNASYRHPFFWVDDAYLTGLLPRIVPAEIQYFNFGKLFTLSFQKFEMAVLESPVVKIIVVPAGGESTWLRFWSYMIDKKYPDLAKYGIE